MSFRAGEFAQWNEPQTSGVTVRPAYLVESGGRYQVSTTGPAAAFFGDAGGGRVQIDAAATAHANGVRLLAVGPRIRAF